MQDRARRARAAAGLTFEDYLFGQGDEAPVENLKIERYELVAPEGPWNCAQVCADNAQLIAVWAGGTVSYKDREQAVVEIPAWREGERFQSWSLQVGDWVVLDIGRGRFEVWPDAKFRERFRRTP
jgi:hypothetical protein